MDLLFSTGLPMTQDEKAFFKAMGTRIAEHRKSSSITQVQLAQTMSVSQQTVASWEVGKRGPTPKLQQQVERLARLPKTKQRVVMEMLEGLLSQAAR
jgi:DNA-binding transcriptional regulator YiaG